jgi:hypothetical protein
MLGLDNQDFDALLKSLMIRIVENIIAHLEQSPCHSLSKTANEEESIGEELDRGKDAGPNGR